MSKYALYEEKLQGLHPVPADEDFLRQVDLIVAELMSSRQANIGSISDRLCIHTSKLRRRIEEITGLTPTQYIVTLRLRRALQLLARQPRPTMAWIAAQCGFADHAHFTHVFHRLMDTTPQAYNSPR